MRNLIELLRYDLKKMFFIDFIQLIVYYIYRLNKNRKSR